MTLSHGKELIFCYGCMKQLDRSGDICPYCGFDNRKPNNGDELLPEGTVLAGKYLVGKKLGRGGFGVTYLGYDLMLEKIIAIKEYFPVGLSYRITHSGKVSFSSSLEGDTGFSNGLEVFREEALNLARFDNPNIVRVRDFLPENGTAYIIMDFLRGNDLSKEISLNGRIPWERVRGLFNPLIRALETLHQNHLIHRDIKPENIKILPSENSRPERLVLLDFGSARRYLSENVTGTYTAMVTPGFAPLEQYARRGRQGPFTDVYGICASMYACITGTVPPASLDISIGEESLKPIEEFGLSIPDHVQKAIMHGMALRADNRTQTMEELYRELNSDERVNNGTEDKRMKTYVDALQAKLSNTPEDFRKALSLFSQIPGYLDADLQAELCRENLNTFSCNEENRKIYERAKSLIATETLQGYQNAENLFRQISGYQDSDTLVEECEKRIRNLQSVSALISQKPDNKPEPRFRDLKPGDTLPFGRFIQSDDPDGSQEPIVWQVLAVENKRALLISKYGLDSQPYNSIRKNVTWETCSLREWLNNEFYQSAFNSGEKARIAQILNLNPDNSIYGTKGGNRTQDQIFLLSIDEAEKYFRDDGVQECKTTAYAKKNGAYVSGNDNSWWWLRSPGNYSIYAAIVDTHGVVSTHGNDINDACGVIRPALWLDL